MFKFQNPFDSDSNWHFAEDLSYYNKMYAKEREENREKFLAQQKELNNTPAVSYLTKQPLRADYDDVQAKAKALNLPDNQFEYLENLQEKGFAKGVDPETLVKEGKAFTVTDDFGNDKFICSISAISEIAPTLANDQKKESTLLFDEFAKNLSPNLITPRENFDSDLAYIRSNCENLVERFFKSEKAQHALSEGLKRAEEVGYTIGHDDEKRLKKVKFMAATLLADQLGFPKEYIIDTKYDKDHAEGLALYKDVISKEQHEFLDGGGFLATYTMAAAVLNEYARSYNKDVELKLARTELEKSELTTKAEPVKEAPAKAEPVKEAQAKAEPVKEEPAKENPSKDTEQNSTKASAKPKTPEKPYVLLSVDTYKEIINQLQADKRNALLERLTQTSVVLKIKDMVKELGKFMSKDKQQSAPAPQKDIQSKEQAKSKGMER